MRRGSGLLQCSGSVLRRAVQDVRLVGCSLVARGPLFRWLAQLFDLDFDADLNRVDWSRLLEQVAERLHADAEPTFYAEFPWPLLHLSVLGVRGRAMAAFRAVWSWSISAARPSSWLMVMVVRGSERIHVSDSPIDSQVICGSSMIVCPTVSCSPQCMVFFAELLVAIRVVCLER